MPKKRKLHHSSKTRVKTAQNRGDDTADAKKLSNAIGAFNKVWKA